MSSNASSIIGIVKETSPGILPNEPQFTSQRFSSANFSQTRPELLDDSKANTRQYLYAQVGNKEVAGSLSGAFAFDNYELLMESCFYKEFNAGDLIMGDDIITIAIEEGQPDANIPLYKLNTGCIVNSMTVNSPVDGLTTIDFEIMGLKQEIFGSTQSEEAYSEQPENEPFIHCAGTIKEDGDPLTIATDMNFTISNNLETVHTWGDCDPHSLVPARIDVTGTLTTILEDDSMLEKFIDNENSSIEFTLLDNENKGYKITIPKVKYTSADNPIDSGSGVRTVSMNFRALMDPLTNTTVKIEKID